MDPLLAKSYDRNRHKDSPPSYALLTQHSRDVAAACDALSSIVGRVALHNAGLSEELFEDFQVALRINGWMQDLGKASNHFQDMVTNPFEARKQLIRHEVISGMLFWNDSNPSARWFKGLPLSDPLRLMSLWGAIGHHRKFDEDTKPEHCNRLSVRVTHDDFKSILAEMSKGLRVDAPEDFDSDVVFAYSRREADPALGELGGFESVRKMQDDFDNLKEEFREPSMRRMLALIKAFGIAADVAASAVAKDEYKKGHSRIDYIERFVQEKLSVGLTANELDELAQKRLAASGKQTCATGGNDSTVAEDTFDERDAFQARVAKCGSDGTFLTVARAGCGSGKSIAAYKWAQAWCERFARENRKNFRLFFCLPTTGTTTEHYKDYALESGIDNAALVHSRRDVDLMEIAQTAPQESATDADGDQQKAARQALAEIRDRIESLEIWSTALVVSTTDTVLGLMANARRAIYSIPAIMSGAIVFDEVHAYDDQLFGHLLVFISNFPRLPILLMTASLPEQRLRAIRHARPDVKDEDIIEGPPAFENLKRYIVRERVSVDNLDASIEDCLRRDGKVLWVCNRVERANDSYRNCRERFGARANVNVYHSRFRYLDRSRRHRRVIDDFNSEDRAAILVATQVAEMSLDLSADLLITDIAPVPALIQRMGRLNRRATPSDPERLRQPKPALVLSLPTDEHAKPLPYEKDEIDLAWKWLEKLRDRGNGVSQRNLAETFANLESTQVDVEKLMKRAERNACFFSGLWRTRPGETRVDGYTVSIVLQDDIEKCDDFAPNAEPSRNWIRKHEIAIPFKTEVLGWRRVGTVREAPRDRVLYDYNPKTKEGTGAEWITRK
jgi:CRISPR-associated endonuclease/helicase Cas3